MVLMMLVMSSGPVVRCRCAEQQRVRQVGIGRGAGARSAVRRLQQRRVRQCGGHRRVGRR